MAIIALLTDFGDQDEYVGLMKGVILSICPAARIVDLCHRVKPQDITQAAFIIQAAWRYFPKTTIHLVVVDPGVGGRRAIIAVQVKGQVILAPDNGVLTRVVDDQKPDAAVRVENAEFFLDSVSPTFHGRDIFAPVAAHIANGIALDRLGPKLNPAEIMRIKDLTCHITPDGQLVGRIVGIDRFGNLLTNIDAGRLKDFRRSGQGSSPTIKIGDRQIHGLSETYAKVPPGAPAALVGSRGYLEIAVNLGSARRHFNATSGDLVRVTL